MNTLANTPFTEALDPAGVQDAEALATFLNTGLPTKALEAWKQTNLRPIAQQAFAVAGVAEVDGAWLDRLDTDPKADRVVFVNGVAVPNLWRVGDLPDGVVLSARSQSKVALTVQGQASAGFGAIDALNRAYAADGLLLRVPDGAALPRPVQVLDLAISDCEQQQIAHLRHDVVLGSSAQAVLTERVAGRLGAAQLNTAVWTGQVGDNAGLKLSRLCALPDDKGLRLQRIDLQLGRDAQADIASADLGARLLRVDTDVVLTAPGGEARVSGVYFADQGGHIDNHTRIDHAAPHTTSRETFRGVAAGKSKAVFNGMVVVEQGAQKTDSDQQTAALLLSDRAEIAAKPELEIYADDVKCAHGNSIGQLDDNALFYLRSRGLDDETARTVLTFSFLNSVLEQMPDAATRGAATRLIRDRMPGGERLADVEELAS